MKMKIKRNKQSLKSSLVVDTELLYIVTVLHHHYHFSDCYVIAYWPWEIILKLHKLF